MPAPNVEDQSMGELLQLLNTLDGGTANQRLESLYAMIQHQQQTLTDLAERVSTIESQAAGQHFMLSGTFFILLMCIAGVASFLLWMGWTTHKRLERLEAELLTVGVLAPRGKRKRVA